MSEYNKTVDAEELQHLLATSDVKMASIAWRSPYP
jgi:hypothetical protein